MDALVEFLHREQAQSKTIRSNIAHGGFLNNFPILLANCIKHSSDNYSILENCMYVDSMLMFRNAGYAKTGLDALCQEFNIAMEVRDYHSALHDAEKLIAICMRRVDVLLLLDHSLSFNNILLHLNEKLPTPIWRVFNLARECSSRTELEYKLYEFRKSALNHKQVCKIAYWYLKDRYLYLKKL